MENPIKEKQTDTQSKVTPVNGKNLVRENQVKGHPSGGKRFRERKPNQGKASGNPVKGDSS